MSTLSEDRRRAIERSGWGEEFRLVQPHNLAFWVLCLLVVAGAIVLSGQLSIAAAAYSGALTDGIIAFGLLAVAYLLYIRFEDRYTTVPPKLAATGFVWGFVAAIGAFALLGNDAVMSLYSKAFGASFAFDWGAALTAPVNEELAKGAGVLLLLTLAPRLIRSPFDGLIVGALIGLGFQISEDISYAWIGAANAFGDVTATWGTIIARSLASIPSHWMYTGVFGAGLVWFIGRPDFPARKGLGAGLMLTAMVMHGLWDASGAIAGDQVISIVPAIVAFALISVFVWVYNSSVSVEREWMRELMAPEVALGIVKPDELEALAGTRTMLKDYVRAQPSRRRAVRVLETETHLAHQIARDGGAETEAVQSARAAVGRARAT
ncbi:MAG TPA: PrsW family intramembrane metalloprotease [Solirubrobacteraceae bacterium]|nr:PrsW family intramembrane metalloprotease [Solirubrobacteraceae bacterium]